MQTPPENSTQDRQDSALPSPIELLVEFDARFGDAVEEDVDINGGDAVEWISEFAPLVRATLNALAGLARLAPPEEALIPVCRHCGSEEITADASARWNPQEGRWDVCNVFDKGHHCDDCDGETKLEFRPAKPS